MTQQRGADLLVECLVNQEVDHIFGVPGESYLSVLDALVEAKGVDFVNARNEGGASFMAEAYGKLKGKAGICFVTRGPGATNASIGVHTAMQNSSPMVLFIGQVGREMVDREAFQEIDYRAFFGPICKWVTQIDDADRIPELVGRAFSVALSGRQGPVVVSLPEDMLRDMTNASAVKKVIPVNAKISTEELKDAISRLGKAKQPLILASGGGWTAQGRDDLQSFAEANHIPVVVGFRSQDLMETNSPVYVGDASFGKPTFMKDLITSSDCILALNLRFGEVLSDAWSLFDFPTPEQDIIHVHPSSREIGKVYQPALGIVADPNSVTKELRKIQLAGKWVNYCKRAKAAFVDSRKTPKTKGKVNMAKVCGIVDRLAELDAIFTNGAGNFAIWPGKYLNYGAKRRLLAPQAGAMGAGVPAAVAAKVAFPERQAICFAGDGDFQMNFQELGTALQKGLGPIILINNNSSYGTIRMHQENAYPDRVSGTDLLNPKFQSIADAYGFGYKRVEDDAEFEAAFVLASKAAFGFIIEMICDPRDIAPNKILNIKKQL